MRPAEPIFQDTQSCCSLLKSLLFYRPDVFKHKKNCPLPGAGTGSEILVVLKCVCVRSSDAVSNLMTPKFVFDDPKIKKSPGRQMFESPEFQSKRKRRAMLFGAGYTKYQPGMIFLDLFRAKNVFLWRTTNKASEHQSKVLLN